MADTGLDPFRPLDAVERARASIDRGLSNEGFAPVVPVPDDASEPDWNWQGSRKPAAVWRYHDERGGLLSYVARFDRPDGGKDIVPFTFWRDRSGASVWRRRRLPGPNHLYGVDRLASDQERPVLVVEGEKCADAGHTALPSFIVITSQGGAEAAHKSDWSLLAGRSVLIWPDADEPGLRYAQTVAKLAAEAGAGTIQIIDAMAFAMIGPQGEQREPKASYDVADAVEEGWDPAVLLKRILALASVWTSKVEDAAEHQGAAGIEVPVGTITSDPILADTLRKLAQLPPGDYQKLRKAEAKRLGLTVTALDHFIQVLQEPSGRDAAPAQRDTLLKLAADADLWRDPSGEAYATAVEDGRRKSFRVRSGDFRGWLIRLWMKHHGGGTGLMSTPGGQALQDAIAAVEAKAQQGAENPVYIRIGHAAGKIYVDLGDLTWSAVEITSDGWRIIDDAPVRFIRPSGLRPLPRPVQHESGLGALRSILPDATDAKDAQILLLSFVVGAFMPEGSLPLLALSGRQGSGKSTQTRRLRQLIDPNQAPARQQPRTEDDLIIAARNGALVAFDNLSRITQDMSDALCRLATGAGFSKRRLYSDSDELIVQVRRPVIINGITDLVRMPDLADRALFIELPTRRSFIPETDLEQTFERDQPGMLGTLYNAVSAALARYGNEECSPGIRLADFERWVRAAAPAFGIGPDDVSAALISNRTLGDRMLIDDDIVASLILKLLDEHSSFAGTATDLLARLRDLADPGDVRTLPGSARGLTTHLRRFVPAFERVGIRLHQSREGADRQRTWTIEPHARRRIVEEF